VGVGFWAWNQSGCFSQQMREITSYDGSCTLQMMYLLDSTWKVFCWLTAF
jgi:hypothetical protein